MHVLFAGLALALAAGAGQLPAQSMGAQSRGVIGISVSVMPRFKVGDPTVLSGTEADRGRAGPAASALLSNTRTLRYTVQLQPLGSAGDHMGEAAAGPAHCAGRSATCPVGQSGSQSHPRLLLIVPD